MAQKGEKTLKNEVSGSAKGRVVLFRGRKVKVVEPATGFVQTPNRSYWVRALEPVAGFQVGEEFTVSKRIVHEQIRRKTGL